MDPKLTSLINKGFTKIVYLDEFSKLGDSLTNLIFSLSLTKVLLRFDGAKVSNFVLSEALKRSKFSFLIKKRQSRHKKGNIVEAILLYCWMKEHIGLFEMVNILSNGISISESRTEQNEIFIASFIELLNQVFDKMDKNGEVLGY